MANIAWGRKVSDTFLDRVAWIVDDLQIGINTIDGMNKLMSCMAWESNRTFSANVANMAGSGAIGLIQFMPKTAIALGTTADRLAKMTAEDQLNYVWKYFEGYRGKLKTIADLYMAILWPVAVSEPETYVLWTQDAKPTTYRQNIGLDVDKNGTVIKSEAAAKVAAMMAEGMQPENVREYKVPQSREHQLDLPTVIDTVKDVVDVLPVPHEVTAVIDTADAVTSVVSEPKTTSTTIKQAVGGWQGTLAGIVTIVCALLLDPNFSSLLGRFTTALATGNGRWGAFAALVGAGLVAYRHRSAPQ